jgi:hypothetical protein
MLFYPAALSLPSGPALTPLDHPPPPEACRLTAAQAQPGSAGPTGAGLPAQRRNVRRAGGRIRMDTSTAWRYVNEKAACWSPGPRNCAGPWPRPRRLGHAYLVIDGTLIPIDRVAADRPFYSGKYRKHGMNLQVIVSPDGDLLGLPAGAGRRS